MNGYGIMIQRKEEWKKLYSYRKTGSGKKYGLDYPEKKVEHRNKKL